MAPVHEEDLDKDHTVLTGSDDTVLDGETVTPGKKRRRWWIWPLLAMALFVLGVYLSPPLARWLTEQLPPLFGPVLPEAQPRVDMDVLQGQLHDLERRIDQAQQERQALQQQLADLEAVVSATSTTGLADQVLDLQQQVSAFEARLTSAESGAPGEMKDRLLAFETQHAELSERLDQLAQRLAALSGRLDGLAMATPEQVAALEDRLGDVRTRQQQQILLADLKQIFDQGGYVTPVLNRLAATLPDPVPEDVGTALVQLKGPAPQTTEQLRATFNKAVALQAADDLTADIPLWQKVRNWAAGLVTVERSGTAAPSDLPVTAQLDAALAAGDLATATSLYKTLPASLQGVLADWRMELDQRLAGLAALQTLDEFVAGVTE